MLRDGHRSRAEPVSGRDQRPTDLVNHAHSNHLISQASKQLASDPYNGMLLEWMSHSNRRGLQTGVIRYAHPYLQWYKVQLDGVSAQIGCTTVGQVGLTPIGVRNTGALPPQSHVVVWVPPGRTFGLILGCYTPICQDPKLLVPDYSVQGGQAGMKREDAYKLPLKNTFRQGHLLDFSAGRPIDSLNNEWGRITETGIELMIDSFQAFLRVNEACGLFLNYFDSHTRLAGINMDIQSAGHEISARLDEGENRYVHSDNTYPWEALGLYASGTAANQTFDDADVQYRIAKGKYDLADADNDLQPIARYQEHGGYLGQGRLRTVMVPNPKGSGKRHFADDPKAQPDLGVFRESIGMDGSYLMEFAKRGSIIKRSIIPVAKEVRLPEDQKTGDDARKDNYKFSGKFGSGSDHKVGDIAVNGEDKGLLLASALDDIITYQSNWQAVHPFHYHTNDFTLPEESDLKNAGGPQRVQENLDFGSLGGDMYMADPQPHTVKVDHRYGSTQYYDRQAGFSFLEDGGIVIFDGYGSQIILSKGNIRFECPGNIMNFPGVSSITMSGRDIIQRAKHSFDLTAGDGDGRIKAQNNLMMLGGNNTSGGVLIESRAPGFIADFDGKIGEQVVSGGIMLKAAKSGVAVWGGDIYLRTGGGGSNSGPIVLDANKGQDQVILQGQTVDVFAQSSFNAWIGPAGSNDDVTATFNFTSSGALIDKAMICGGEGAFLGSVIIQGGVACVDGYASVNNTPFVGSIDGGKLSAALGEVSSDLQNAEQAGSKAHGQVFAQGLYQDNQPGNDTVIRQAEFGYRDDGGQQYLTTQFRLPESRWQMMVRLGLGSGGAGWDEPPVNYQGVDQLPWPGQDNWSTPTLLELPELTMFDPGTGCGKDRTDSAYETPEISTFVRGVPKTDFKVIG